MALKFWDASVYLLHTSVHYALVFFVQFFMLVQVGAFDVLRRLKGQIGRLRSKRSQVKKVSHKVLPTTLSVIIPAFNEARSIRRCLTTLLHGATEPKRVQIIVVDAGCHDETMAIISDWAKSTKLDVVKTESQGGRGPAIRAGVRLSTGDVVLVLHADTALPPRWDDHVLGALADPGVSMTAFSFGCDRTQLVDSRCPPVGLALMEQTVNWRSRWFELPFGDQALATRRETLYECGGYPATCILEEFILVNQLRALSAAGGGRIVTLRPVARCSPRRWERSTVWRVNAVNQAVMLWHRFGATPAQIFEFYYGMPAPVPQPDASPVSKRSGILSGNTAAVLDCQQPTAMEWDRLSRCVNGERSLSWASLFAKQRVLFVHIPRCAGTSLEASMFGQTNYSQHLTTTQLSQLLGAAAYKGCFRFTFVRDPVDRYLSAFYYLLHRGGAALEREDANSASPDAGGQCKRASNGMVGSQAISPHDILASDMLREEFGSSPLAYLRHLDGLVGEWQRVPLHLRPQTYFFPANDLAGMHFVGRFENLQTCYAELLLASEGRLQGMQTSLPHLRAARERVDSSARAEARTAWAKSKELNDLVRRVYAADYVVLGYS